MPLIGNDDLVRIDLPTPGEWVEVKRRLSRGDEIAVQQAVVKGAQVIAGSPVVQLDTASAIEAAEFATLDMAIKRWSFDVPISPLHIRALDGESIDAIKERLNDLYPAARTEDERRDLSEPSAVQSEDMAALLSSSPGSS